jgi:hypothetical protein
MRRDQAERIGAEIARHMFQTIMEKQRIYLNPGDTVALNVPPFFNELSERETTSYFADLIENVEIEESPLPLRIARAIEQERASCAQLVEEAVESFVTKVRGGYAINSVAIQQIPAQIRDRGYFPKEESHVG